MTEKQDNTLSLKTNDGKVFKVLESEVSKAETIRRMCADVPAAEGEDEEIPLQNISSTIFNKVLEWLKHHKDDPPMPEDDENREKRTDDIPPWDQEFLKVDQGTLFEIILAANFLDIKGLLDVSCKTVANMIKGKTPEEIRKTFNIVNDFTPQEEEQIKKENSWCEEK
ncbi:S-phase kinase-associated protein 1-like isoform X4 [Symsagittifera roscoffensis]|uniref:S-phase kinase-associated protein 1-like isoform X4 n=1 Tax=Symsagittifera roscoffensis TaxID=84072 RepID=UPI00307B48B1